jgi:mannose-1-phosphate guanylyltransferase
MLPVCGIPILGYGLTNLVAHGIRDVVINLHHKGDLIQRELGDGRAYGARITYLEEPTILGTGGGLKHALSLLDPDKTDEPFLSINGKLIFDLDITALVAAYRISNPIAMMVVRRVPDAKAWGAVEVATDGRITNILSEGEHMFCGAHVTRPSVIARLPDGESDSIRQGYLPWLRAGEPVLAFEHVDGYFAEHSTPERYLESNRALLAGTPLRHPPGRLSGVDPTARIHPTAKLVEPLKICARAVIGANVTIGPYAVVGEGAIVERDLAHTVVWAHASANAANAGEPIVI